METRLQQSVRSLADTDGIWEVPDEEIVSHAGSN